MIASFVFTRKATIRARGVSGDTLTIKPGTFPSRKWRNQPPNGDDQLLQRTEMVLELLPEFAPRYDIVTLSKRHLLASPLRKSGPLHIRPLPLMRRDVVLELGQRAFVPYYGMSSPPSKSTGPARSWSDGLCRV